MNKIYPLIFLALLLPLSSLAEVKLNFDALYTSTTTTTKTTAGTTTKSSGSTIYFITSLLFVDFSGLKLGGSYYKENSDAVENESLVGLSFSYGEDFFIELIVGQYKLAQSTGADLTGIGYIISPGKLFKMGGNIDLRVSIPFIQRDYKDSNENQISKLTYTPFVGVRVSF